MSSFLSRPHPHNLSPVRMRALWAGAGGDGGRAGGTGSARGSGRLGACHSAAPRLGEGQEGLSALGTGLGSSG